MLRRWHPDRIAPGIATLDPHELRAEGIDGAIVDLDNTLVGYRMTEALPADADWIRRAAEAEFRLVMVTNNATPWAKRIAGDFGIPCITNARKPLPGAFRRALGVLELPRERVVVIGDQFFTDVLGAKLFGLRVILVPPLVRHDPLNTLPLRLLERLLGFKRE